MSTAQIRKMSSMMLHFFIFRCSRLCCSSNLFLLFDKNGDGSVDFSEFVLSCGVFKRRDIGSEFDLAFAL
jgi:Ca2+-binding EF-hand superfamily protein